MIHLDVSGRFSSTNYKSIKKYVDLEVTIGKIENLGRLINKNKIESEDENVDLIEDLLYSDVTKLIFHIETQNNILDDTLIESLLGIIRSNCGRYFSFGYEYMCIYTNNVGYLPFITKNITDTIMSIISGNHNYFTLEYREVKIIDNLIPLYTTKENIIEFYDTFINQ